MGRSAGSPRVAKRTIPHSTPGPAPTQGDDFRSACAGPASRGLSRPPRPGTALQDVTTDATKNGRKPVLARFRRRLAAATRCVAAAAAGFTGVDARLAAVGGILPEANVFEALRLATVVADIAATSRRERARLCVDDTTQHTGLPAGVRQATRPIDSLAVAIALLLLATRAGARPSRRCEHRTARDGQDGRPQDLDTSVRHDFLLPVKHILTSLRSIKRPATSSRAEHSKDELDYQFLIDNRFVIIARLRRKHETPQKSIRVKKNWTVIERANPRAFVAAAIDFSDPIRVSSVHLAGDCPQCGVKFQL